MAQLVKLEPGDILVLANVGEEQEQALRENWDAVRDATGIDRVWVFEGDVDLAKVADPERQVESFGHVHLNSRLTAKEAAQLLSDVPGDGGE